MTEDRPGEPLAQIRALAASVPDTLRELLCDEKTSPAARLKAVEMILERAYGKQDSRSAAEPPKAAMLDDLREEMARMAKEGGQSPTRGEDSGEDAPQPRSQHCPSGRAGRT